MRILTRYLLRLHLAPFLFALTGLTLLLLLDQVSRRFQDLIGKDLHWMVIVEVFVYSIPFILAQTLPMAVLIAVLYTFNRLAGDTEITAMRASGIPLSRLIAPLLLAATILAGGMTWFNNTVLPESNHHLQVLLTSIGRKKPTFFLRERTINEVVPSRLYVQPGAIHRDRSGIEDAAIYDERDGRRSRTIYADSGQMAFDAGGKDLYLTLFDGVLQERQNERPHGFQRIQFAGLVMKVPDVANELERDTLSGYRSDREMNIAQMRERAREGEIRIAEAQRESREYAIAIAERLAAWREPLEASAGPTPGGASASGSPPATEPGSSAAPPRAPPGAGATAGRPVDRGERDAGGEPGQARAGDTVRATASDARLAARRLTHPIDAVSQFTAYRDRVVSGEQQANKFWVEIHKKGSIPAACIVFVLIGAPIAVRFPRAGVALVVGVSIAFFAAYYVSLVGGEELADNRFISPFWAMWAPNVLFGLVGLAALWRATKVTR